MFETIVWATDGSEHADSTLATVTDLARICNSRIVALHVNRRFRGGRFGGGPLLADEDELQEKIASQVDDLRAAGFATELVVVSTLAHDTSASIARAAAEAGADLIVVGTHGYGEVESLFVGSVARSLTHDAQCPVLIVPPLPIATVSAGESVELSA